MSTTGERPDGTPARVITGAEEIAHYDDSATSAKRHQGLKSAVERVRELHTLWAEPDVVPWLDSIPDCAAQADVYVHLKQSIIGGRVLQLGGKGQAVLKALVGGASSGILVTPSQGEADLAVRVARELDIADRFEAKVGFAETLCIDDESVNAIVSEGCMHHTNTVDALKECARVLVPGGRFGSWDPWKARLYTVGVAVFGKRDPDVSCKPLDPARLQELSALFPSGAEVNLHGAMTRYTGLVWSKYVRPLKLSTSYRLTKLDDRVSRHVPAFRRNGSSCAVLAVK